MCYPEGPKNNSLRYFNFFRHQNGSGVELELNSEVEMVTDSVIKFPVITRVGIPFRTFCRETDSFKPLPACSKKPRQKVIWHMEHFIEHHGLVYSIIADENGAVLGGKQYIKKAKAAGLATLNTYQIENLTKEQKQAFSIAYKKMNKLGGVP